MFEVDVTVGLARAMIRCSANLVQGPPHQPELWRVVGLRESTTEVGPRAASSAGLPGVELSQNCRKAPNPATSANQRCNGPPVVCCARHLM